MPQLSEVIFLYLIPLVIFRRIRKNLLLHFRFNLVDVRGVIRAGLGCDNAQLFNVIRAMDCQLFGFKVQNEEKKRVVATNAAEVAPLLEPFKTLIPGKLLRGFHVKNTNKKVHIKFVHPLGFCLTDKPPSKVYQCIPCICSYQLLSAV